LYGLKFSLTLVNKPDFDFRLTVKKKFPLFLFIFL
jgi:hypothetical protein